MNTTKKGIVLIRKDNISTIFLLPCLQIKARLLSKFYIMGFEKSFMFSKKHNYDFNPLFLLFNAKSQFDLNFYMFTQSLEKNQNHVETIDLSPNKILFVFRIPKKFDADYQFFLEGKYSAMSRDFKNLFPEYEYLVDKNGILVKDENGKPIKKATPFYHIFNKTKDLKNLYQQRLGTDVKLPEDLYDKYKPEEETLHYEH